GYTFTILFDRAKRVSREYGVRGIPHSVLIDRKGRVQYAGHPLRIDERLLDDLLQTGARDRKTGKVVASEDRSQREDRKANSRSRRARAAYTDGLDQKGVGNFGRAAESFLEAIEADPSFAEAHKEYVGLMRMMGKGESLLNTYREWIADDPDNAV